MKTLKVILLAAINLLQVAQGLTIEMSFWNRTDKKRKHQIKGNL
jgi:hypothetical protein